MRYRQEIFVMNADGSGETPLTDNTAFDSFPVFSPDGRYIAYSSCPRDGSGAHAYTDCRIWKMRSDGTFQTQLTNGPASEFHEFPDWQPLPAFRLNNNLVTILFNEVAPISGRFVYGLVTGSSSGRELSLWEEPAGSFKHFSSVPGALTTTDKDGFFSFQKIEPQANTNYQVRFAGDQQAGLKAAMSPIKPVNVRVLLSLALSTNRLKLGESLVMSGRVSPVHEGQVILTISRENRKVATKRADLDASSRYSFTYEPTRAGNYSVVASFPADEDHAGNHSPKRTFSVIG